MYTKEWVESTCDFPTTKTEIHGKLDISINIINHEELLLSAGSYFFTYNQTEAQWSVSFDGLKKLESSGLSRFSQQRVVVDAVHGKLYILTLHQGDLFVVDMKSKQVQKYGAAVNGGHLHSFLLNVDGAIHFIGGTGNAKHQIWNGSSKMFETVYDFRNMYDEYDESDAYIDQLSRCCVVYIASKRCLLLLGAHKKFDRQLSHIYEYSLDGTKQQWKVWNKRIRFPYVCSGAIVVKGDRYVICVVYDSIYVLDVNKQILKKSDISRPYEANCVIAKTGTWDILVSGFVNQVVVKQGSHLPAEIVHLIGQFCNLEMLHWIHYQTRAQKHFMIPVNTILKSVE